MSSELSHDTYLLYHRRDDVNEDRRLDSQYEVVKHAILGGRVIDASIPTADIKSVADLGCGTGAWLDDVSNLFSKTGHTDKAENPLLIGFDINARAFNAKPAPGVQFVKQDCAQEFDIKYHGKFDLVHVQALAYTVPEDAFARVVRNMVTLLS